VPGRIISAGLLSIGILATLFGAWASLRMLLSPSKFKQWWYKDLWEASDADPTSKQPRFVAIEYRVAGFFMLIGCLFFTGLLAFALWKGAELSSQQTLPAPSRSSRPDWIQLAMGILLTMGGIYALRNPDSFARWLTRNAIGRRLRDEALPGYSRQARVVGLFFLGGGLLSLLWWVRRSLGL